MQGYKTNLTEDILEDIEKYLWASQKGESYSRFHLTGSGPVSEIESMFRQYYRCRCALSFSSATNALSAIAISIGLQPGDEVIAAPYNWGSSIAGILDLTPAKIIWAKADKDFNILPSSVESLITQKTKAIWACDYEGVPHDMFALREICDHYNLLYVSDAAQSFGNWINEMAASSLADIWVLSFGAGKALDAGEGGMILTNVKIWYDQLLKFQHPYRVKSEVGLDVDNEICPINGRISPIAAIIIKHRMKGVMAGVKSPQHNWKC